MIAKLEKNAEADATKKTYCDKELAETNSKKADKSDEIEDLPPNHRVIVASTFVEHVPRVDPDQHGGSKEDDHDGDDRCRAQPVHERSQRLVEDHSVQHIRPRVRRD